MFVIRKLPQLVLALAVISAGVSCKEKLFETETESQVDAARIPQLWSWIGKYADQLDFLKRTDNVEPLVKNSDVLMSKAAKSALLKIYTKNKTQFSRKANLLSMLDGGVYRLNDYPLKSLPNGIPTKYQKAFEVLRESFDQKGKGKFAARRLVAQMVEKIAEKDNISYQEALARQLDGFVKLNFGTTAKPLPNEFAGVNTFYGHLIKNKAPFIDIAFSEMGVLGPSKAPEKATHGTLVHVLDFFEWSLLCKVSDCGDVKLPELLRYIANNGIAENAVQLAKKIDNPASGVTADAIKAMKAELSESLDLLGIKNLSDFEALRAGKSISVGSGAERMTLNTLDWESGTSIMNGTSLWDVLFDFQNLPDEAFKNKDGLRQAFNNPPAGFLAFSMNVAANPMFVGKPKVLETLFNNLGWH